LVLRYGFRGQPIQRGHLTLPPTNRCCHGNEILDKIGYNSACYLFNLKSCINTHKNEQKQADTDIKWIKLDRIYKGKMSLMSVKLKMALNSWSTLSHICTPQLNKLLATLPVTSSLGSKDFVFDE